jgi:hypothetical protein
MAFADCSNALLAFLPPQGRCKAHNCHFLNSPIPSHFGGLASSIPISSDQMFPHRGLTELFSTSKLKVSDFACSLRIEVLHAAPEPNGLSVTLL